MTRPVRRRGGRWGPAGIAAALALSGCLSGLVPAPPETPRYFRPDFLETEPAGTSGAAGVAGRAGLPLRLREVRASGSLGERIAWRASDVEVGFYEMLRWTDPPAALVEQALAREFYERRGFQRAVSGQAPALAVTVLAFEEVVAPAHEGRVALAVLLTESGRAVVDRVVVTRRPVPDHEASSLARALGDALAEAVEEIGAQVEEALHAARAGPAP
ncbi:MAG TPA: ABC-type transport auxiliary lipoprotein family protein [Thermodesulfobacteriota bacterium]